MQPNYTYTITLMYTSRSTSHWQSLDRCYVNIPRLVSPILYEDFQNPAYAINRVNPWAGAAVDNNVGRPTHLDSPGWAAQWECKNFSPDQIADVNSGALSEVRYWNMFHLQDCKDVTVVSKQTRTRDLFLLVAGAMITLSIESFLSRVFGFKA